VKRLLKILLGCASVAAVGAAGWMGVNRYREQSGGPTGLPVAQARAGEFLAVIRCRGEVKADRSAQVYAPLMPGLRIAWMAPAGDFVEEGAPVIRFDSSLAQQDLIQKEAALRTARATLDQAVAQGRITAEHDQGDLTDAQYQVELANIKTASNEFISRLEAERNRIDLTLAQQKQRLQQATADQHKVGDEVKLAGLKRQAEQAQAEVDLIKSRLERMEVKAPLGGYWIVSTNYSGGIGGLTSGAPFKIGDNVSAGMILAVIPDMTSLVLDAKVEETDRGRIKVGDSVRVRVDAVPELAIDSKIMQISPLAEMNLEGGAGRSFRAYAALRDPDSRIRPGMNGGLDIVIQRIPDAITVPAKAVFTRAGKPIVYLAQQKTFRAVEVEVLARNPDEVAISGIPPDGVVALVEPDAKDGKQGAASGKEGAASSTEKGAQ
jgi:biotin carboxyl carrier protein